MFERDDVALPRVASFFQQEALKQEDEAEAMMGYLAERGGNYCGKDTQVKGHSQRDAQYERGGDRKGLKRHFSFHLNFQINMFCV